MRLFGRAIPALKILATEVGAQMNTSWHIRILQWPVKNWYYCAKPLNLALSTHVHLVIHTMWAKVAPLTPLARVQSYAHKRGVFHNLQVFIHDDQRAQNRRHRPQIPGS